MHATAPTHDDGAYHEAAHDLAILMLARLPGMPAGSINGAPHVYAKDAAALLSVADQRRWTSSRATGIGSMNRWLTG